MRALGNYEKRGFFISLQNLFSFSRKSNFGIIHFQISWRHQMPKHKTKKYISRNNLGSKHSLLMKFGQFMSYYERKNFIKKFCKNCIFQVLLCLQRIKHNFYWKMKFLKEATYIRYVIAKLSKYVQINMLTSSDFFLQKILWKWKRVWN